MATGTQGLFVGKHSQVTRKILKAFYKVHNTLGYGFSEDVYQNALTLELLNGGLALETQKRLMVYYEGRMVGEYRADLVVNGQVIVELKTVQSLADEHETQLLNYLKATTMEVGLLLTFGPSAEFRRKVFSNERKGSITWATSGLQMKEQDTD